MANTTEKTGPKKVTNIIYIGYLCSVCRNPVLATIHIHNPNLAAKSDKAVQKALEDLQSAANLLQAYLQNPHPRHYLGYGMPDANIIYTGWNTPCPICGKTEPWQDIELLRKQSVLSPINEFPNLESAYEWARALLANRKKESDSIFISAESRRHNLRLIEEVDADIARLQEEIENGATVQEVNSTRKRYEQLTQQMKGQSVFSKDRKNTKKELQQCEEALANAEYSLTKERDRLEVEIQKSKIKKTDYLLLQNSYLDGGILVKRKNSIALKLRDKGVESVSGHYINLKPLPDASSVQLTPIAEYRAHLIKTVVADLPIEDIVKQRLDEFLPN